MGYDAIVVLANEMDANGILNKESYFRANYASELAFELSVPYIVTCGWAYRNDSEIKIADAFKSYLVSLGHSSNHIITETTSRDTVGDAVFTRVNISEPMGFKTLCIVTSSYHVPRTRKIFNFVYGSRFGISVKGVDVEFDQTTVSKELSSEAAFCKTFNAVKAGEISQIMEALKRNHPFYNGEIYAQL